MQTLFSTPERQLVNYQFTDVVAGTQLPYHDVRLVCDVVSMDAGAYCDISITPTRQGVGLGTTSARVKDVGQFTAMGKYGHATDIDYSVVISMSGRMRIRIRVVAFDQGEDVPEVIG